MDFFSLFFLRKTKIYDFFVKIHNFNSIFSPLKLFFFYSLNKKIKRKEGKSISILFFSHLFRIQTTSKVRSHVCSKEKGSVAEISVRKSPKPIMNPSFTYSLSWRETVDSIESVSCGKCTYNSSNLDYLIVFFQWFRYA